jgi:hypothetical protein
MAMYSFVPPFRGVAFCGMPSRVFDKLGCATLVLLMIGNYKIQRWGRLQWHDAHTKFNESPPTFQNLLDGTETRACLSPQKRKKELYRTNVILRYRVLYTTLTRHYAH